MTGTFVITYSFKGGVQAAGHIRPGERYTGTTRVVYLPANADGQRALKLLTAAFQQGALFTVGDSVTTGTKNCVRWNMHQKTSTHGGSMNHGWPDPTYLWRLKSECISQLWHTEDVVHHGWYSWA